MKIIGIFVLIIALLYSLWILFLVAANGGFTAIQWFGIKSGLALLGGFILYSLVKNNILI